MDYLQVVIASLIGFVVLFFLTKIIGYRQISELSMFDFINSISIGSIASEVAIGKGEDIILSVIAMVIFGLLTVCLSVITNKSIKARRFITGIPLILMKDGKLYEKNFKKAKIDLNEFLAQCRINGYYNLSEINTSILEPNGKISFLLYTVNDPVEKKDMNVKVTNKSICANIIIDGKIMKENLQNSGYDENWLKTQLHGTKVQDIFLANIEDNNLRIYEKQKTTLRDVLI